MIVSITCSELSISHFCARERMRPRPSKPYASQAGWAMTSAPRHLRDGRGAEIGYRAGALPGRGVLDRDLLACVRETVVGVGQLLDRGHLNPSPVRLRSWGRGYSCFGLLFRRHMCRRRSRTCTAPGTAACGGSTDRHMCLSGRTDRRSTGSPIGQHATPAPVPHAAQATQSRAATPTVRSWRSPPARSDGPTRRWRHPRSCPPRPSHQIPARTRCACRPATAQRRS